MDKRELKMAEQLLAMQADDFDAAAYHDEYRKQVLKLINTKAKGGKVKTLRPKKKKSTDDLANALEASLKRERDELIRGYEVEPDKFIEVSDDNVVDLMAVLKQRLKGD